MNTNEQFKEIGKMGLTVGVEDATPGFSVYTSMEDAHEDRGAYVGLCEVEALLNYIRVRYPEEWELVVIAEVKRLMRIAAREATA